MLIKIMLNLVLIDLKFKEFFLLTHLQFQVSVNFPLKYHRECLINF
jgi:hypothetical protein